MPKLLPDDVSAGPIVIFNLESLLVDTVAGVRRALDSVARMCGHRGFPTLSQDDLRSRSLGDLIGDMSAGADPSLAAEFVEHYWRVYEQQARYQAPLLPGAKGLIEFLPGLTPERHYLSTSGPEVATRLTHRHGLQQTLTSVYTPPIAVCSRARGVLLEQFFRTQDVEPSDCLVISDCVTELYAAQRLGVAALALGYGPSPLQALESIAGLVGVAQSPRDVALWLSAQSMARRCLRTVTRGPSTHYLH